MDYHACELCPRRCGVDRFQTRGFCGQSHVARAARAALHQWEEPCLSGVRGSGAIFFSGCTLRCCFCQNERISAKGYGKELSAPQLARVFLRLQEQGAHNLNLVTPTQFLPSILEALEAAKDRLRIPVVYNCGGYERPEIIKELSRYVDIWLPDLKYKSSALSASYSQAPDYFAFASRSILQMIRQTGPPQFEEVKAPDGVPALIMKKGVIIRHLILPGQREDSVSLLRWMRDALPERSFLVSLLSQYTPYKKRPDYPELNRRITTYEYEKVLETALKMGLTEGFMQKRSSAREEYTPPFQLEGLEKLDLE